MIRTTFASCVALLALISFSSRAHAVAYVWDNPAGGDWTTLANWSPDGNPTSTADTVEWNDLGAPYTATLSSSRTIGGMTLAGSEPTFDLSGTLIQSGGTGTISGGLLTGSGTLQWQGGANIIWSSPTAPSGTLTFRVPASSPATIASLDNSAVGSGWGIGGGQTLAIEGTHAGDSNLHSFVVSNGFTNSGTIRLGSVPTVDSPSRLALSVTNGTLTNAASGVINLYPRNSTGTAARFPWDERTIGAQLDNQGTINNYTDLGIISKAGAAHTNSGTINLLPTYNSPLQLTISGASFTNTGTLALGGGKIDVRVATFNYNAGSTITGTGTLGFGAGGASDIVNWNGPDITTPITFHINTDSRVTLNRTGDWNLLNGQTLTFQPNAGSAQTQLTVSQNINNSGTIQMGNFTPTGDFPAVQRLVFAAGKLTNNPDGVINTLPRSATNFTPFGSFTWSTREIAGELDNQGTFNVMSWDTRLGAAGANHTNSGTINFDSSITKPSRFATLIVTGSSFVNQAGGVISGEGQITMPGSVALTNAGTLSGAVTLQGNYQAAAGGLLSPGSSAGVLAITGNANLAASNHTLEIELGGLAAGTEYDQVTVTGNATLGGLLDVRFIDGFDQLVDENDSFTILTSASLSGTFSNLIEGRVKTSDGWGSFLVSFSGGNLLLTNFEVTPIPEPNSAALLGLGLALVAVRRRRR